MIPRNRVALIGALCAIALIGSYALPYDGLPSARAAQADSVSVRLCVSAPLTDPGAGTLAIAQGIANAVTLATEQWQTRFRKAGLHLMPPVRLAEWGKSGRDIQHAERANALTCVRRNDTYGYIGPLYTLDALISEPILNRAGMVQISGSNSGVALTNPELRSRQEPGTFAGRLRNLTYYRTVTTDALEGASSAAFLREQLHGSSYFLIDDSLPYGVGLAATMRAYARKLGLRVLGVGQIDTTSLKAARASVQAMAPLIAARNPDGVLFGGIAYYALTLPGALSKAGYTGPIIGGDPIITPDFPSGHEKASAKLFGVSPGVDPAAAARPFRESYRRRFHVPLQWWVATSFDAANIALYAIKEAVGRGRLRGTLAQRRAAVLPYVAGGHWYGATGITTFDRNGDTRNRSVSVYRRRPDAWIYYGRAPEVGVPSIG